MSAPQHLVPAHNEFGSYGVMLLALGILLVGVTVLTVTWRRRARPSPEPSEEQGA